MARSNGDLEGARAAQFRSDRFGATEQALAADSPLAGFFVSYVGEPADAQRYAASRKNDERI